MNFKPGDLIFLHEKIDSQKPPLSFAISEVTKAQFGVESPSLSHMGMLVEKDKTWQVMESRERVRITPFENFIELSEPETPSTKGWYWGRLQNPDTALIQKTLGWIEALLGQPYNQEYVTNGKSYYCAELIAEAFKFANNGSPIFEYQPMYFGNPGEPAHNMWKAHFEKLKQIIPEGKPGISPLGIYLHPKVERLR